jgi:Domain of unknown function (DUF1788)
MTGTIFTSLDRSIAALRSDLQEASGPKISTMRNYRFAILVYDPTEEFKLRRLIRNLSDDLKGGSWNVRSISLHQLLLNRIKAEDPQLIESMMRMEHRLYERDPDRALNHLKDKLSHYIDGVDGIAKDVINLIDEFATENPLVANRTLVLLARTGALYPFFRSSALLKLIDGKMRNLPVVLLYPGKRQDLNAHALSFMGELSADRDYRPRIYS